ncbi:Ig-like domain-containing protein [Clostridium intestinale]|uniref:Ig-like domain-containing protein n=1 Tax=Clostridium intestinale TaxID=36845 RepID=UPI002DD618D8|nr:Ig-like domain-containing protein [Clostridium intestinale]WRY53135.1 Ig-like domain-containing protein [Clostridium intestinale]
MKIQSKKKFIAFSLVVILATIFSLTWIQGSNASAATVGQQLTAPEAGWQRFDDTDSNFKYTGNWTLATYSGRYKGANRYTHNKIASVKFDFYGTKLRIIGNYTSDRVKQYIKIDNDIYDFSTYNSSLIDGQYLVFEKTGLAEGRHMVEVYNSENFSENRNSSAWDAIDIDENGYLIDSSAVLANEISLNKTSLSLNMGQTEDLIASIKPDNVSIKNVTWTSSDESIATVDENGKVMAIKPGNITITAKTTDGTNLTATCTVTVVQPSNDRAILAITMTNGQTKEYDLPNSEIEAFTNWFDSSNGKGQPKFGFNKKIQPYKEVKEYVVFDKISSYEVRSYTISN